MNTTSRTNSRTNALTVIAPLRRGRLWWCRLKLPMLRVLATWSSLVRLRFIHFAGWTVIGDLPGPRSPGWRPRPSMLFLSNYDGDPREYLAAFGIAIPTGMRWSFGSYAGFPGPRPTRLLIKYTNQHCYRELLQYSAYPDQTVRDIDAALQVSQRVEAMRATYEQADETSFDRAYHQLLDALARAPHRTKPSLLAGLWSILRDRSTVSGLTVIVPIDPDQQDELMARIDALAADEPSPLDAVAGLHFARLAVVPMAGRRAEARDHLVFAAWVDGLPEQAAARLAEGLGECADLAWGHCSDYPGGDDTEALAAWIRSRHLPASLFLEAQLHATVKEIKDALALRDRALDAIAAVQGLPLPDIRRELKVL